MSVPKSKRNLSDFEFYNNAMKLSKEITILFINNFNKLSNIKYSNKGYKKIIINKNNKYIDEEFNKIINQYNNDISIAIENNPLWILHRKRNLILNLIDQLINSIVMANTIYPTSKNEYYAKRYYQTKSIGICQSILAQFQIIISFNNIKVDKYKRYIDMIDNEIHLLKEWRTKTHKIFKYLT